MGHSDAPLLLQLPGEEKPFLEEEGHRIEVEEVHWADMQHPWDEGGHRIHFHRRHNLLRQLHPS